MVIFNRWTIGWLILMKIIVPCKQFSFALENDETPIFCPSTYPLRYDPLNSHSVKPIVKIITIWIFKTSWISLVQNFSLCIWKSKFLSPLWDSFSVWGGSFGGATVVVMVVGAVLVVVIVENTVVATVDTFVVLTRDVVAPASIKHYGFLTCFLHLKHFHY